MTTFNPYEIETYIGMNFQKWCQLDEEDERTLNIALYNQRDKESYSFVSYEEVTPYEMKMLQNSTIKNIDLVDNEWYIELIFDGFISF